MTTNNLEKGVNEEVTQEIKEIVSKNRAIKKLKKIAKNLDYDVQESIEQKALREYKLMLSKSKDRTMIELEYNVWLSLKEVELWKIKITKFISVTSVTYHITEHEVWIKIQDDFIISVLQNRKINLEKLAKELLIIPWRVEQIRIEKGKISFA